MEYYQKEADDLLKEFHSSKQGLSSEEARKRLKRYGLNELKRTKKVPALKLFLNQFRSFIIYVLIAAALVAFILGERIDAIAIAVIVILNAILGFVQEFKAEKAIEALKKLSTPKTRVKRGGKVLEIDSTLLVPGDIIVIEEGSFIPADARLLSESSFSVDESVLTGESVPVHKTLSSLKKRVQVSSQKNMVFAGTVASRGRAEALVLATGFYTELGKIASGIQEIKREPTPLQKQLKYLGNFITIGVLIICLVVFVIGFLRTQQLLESLINAIALAVAAIPEGLPAIITITLALGTQKILKRKGLIRRLHAVETLGSTSVICADKTGTITKNQMEVIQIYTDNKLMDVNKGFLHEGKHLDPKKFSRLFEIGVACNNAVVDGPSDPTEKALLLVAKKTHLKFDFKREKEIPFSSESKFMATLDKTDGKSVMHYKGAPEIILGMCHYISVHGRVKKLTKKERERLLKESSLMAANALRVLAFAYADAKKPKHITFVGLMGMLDPPREHVRESIGLCKDAGIRVVMITGDHLLTAKAIARQVGISGKALTGDEIDKLSKEQLKKVCGEVDIYARVSPEHKLKILSCIQARGKVVAMTGDGVNDALALKKSNIGIATGTATDVAKEASDMMLLDNNFVSIVAAVREGRGIYANLKKFIHYLLTCNLGEVLIIFIALLIGWPIPLFALQILWVNLLTDGLPALALGVDPIAPGIMKRPPRRLSERIISKKDTLLLLVQGILLTVSVLALYWFYLKKGDVPLAQTVAFTSLVIGQMYIALNYRLGSSSVFSGELFRNKWLWLAIASSVGLQLLVVYGLSSIFRTVPLVAFDWILIVIVSASVLVLHEFVKKIFSRTIA